MSAPETFDAVIIGAGQAGPPLAGRLTRAGQRVALIERHRVGGTCVNTGCTPTKTLIASARVAHMARRAGEFGVRISGPVGIDFSKVMARMERVSAASREGLEHWLDAMEGLDFIRGHARFEGPDTVRVGDRVLRAPHIFINTGGRAAIPDFPGLGEVECLTNTSILALKDLPGHLVVVGGSYVGLEFAQMFRRLGAEVTVIERGPRLVAPEDAEISQAVQAILEGEGIAVRLEAECIGFFAAQGAPTVRLDCEAGAREVSGTHVLLAVGRRPNTDDLGLDAAGVATDEKGFVVVDDMLETSVKGIWALGDCNGRGAFTHTAYNDFEIVAANLLDGDSRRVSDRFPAYALYTDPPLGRVGLSEAEAHARGHHILVGRREMTRVSRAVEKGETAGLIKIVVDADSEAILGAAILGVGGDEAIHGLIDVMQTGARYTTLARTMHIHPTVSELIPTVLGALEPAR